MDITSFLEKNFGKGKELDHESAENVLRDALLCFDLSELEPVWRELTKQNSGNRLFTPWKTTLRQMASGRTDVDHAPRVMQSPEQPSESNQEDFVAVREELRESVSISGESGVCYMTTFGWQNLSVVAIVVHGKHDLSHRDCQTLVIRCGGGYHRLGLLERAKYFPMTGIPTQPTEDIGASELRTLRQGREKVLDRLAVDRPKEGRDRRIVPGSSIGGPLAESLVIGTATAAIRPMNYTDAYPSGSYILSVGHVAARSRSIEFPAPLVRASHIHQSLQDDPSNASHRSSLIGGDWVAGDVLQCWSGADSQETRCDFMIARLRDGYKASNGTIYGKHFLRHGGSLTGRSPSDKMEIVVKPGAATGFTEGRHAHSEVIVYEKRDIGPEISRGFATTEKLDMKEWVDGVAETRVFIVRPTTDENFCDFGDSGSPILRVVSKEKAEYHLAGVLVGCVFTEVHPYVKLGAVVSQQDLFRQLYDETDVEWEIVNGDGGDRSEVVEEEAEGFRKG